MRTIQVATLGVAVIVGHATVVKHVSVGAGAQAALSGNQTVVDAEGQLHVPDDYREAYQFLGSWAIAADNGRGSSELHVVYASPGAIDSYRQDKRFPDGAVLIKEVFRTTTKEMTTGTVSHANTLKGWFVMVKDET